MQYTHRVTQVLTLISSTSRTYSHPARAPPLKEPKPGAFSLNHHSSPSSSSSSNHPPLEDFFIMSSPADQQQEQQQQAPPPPPPPPSETTEQGAQDPPAPTFKVQLAVYDLSQGMARQLGPAILGFEVEAIYHTGVIVYGKEVSVYVCVAVCVCLCM